MGLPDGPQSQSIFPRGRLSKPRADRLPSDTNNNGQVVPVSGVSVEILSVSDESLVEAGISGQTINVNSLDDDSNGVVEISLRASDGSKSSDTTVTFYVLNVNDAPRIDSSDIDELTMKIGENLEIDMMESRYRRFDEEIWITIKLLSRWSSSINFNDGCKLAKQLRQSSRLRTVTGFHYSTLSLLL